MCASGELENVSRCSRAQLSGWSRVSVVRDCDPPTRAPVCVLPATPMGLSPRCGDHHLDAFPSCPQQEMGVAWPPLRWLWLQSVPPRALGRALNPPPHDLCPF